MCTALGVTLKRAGRLFLLVGLLQVTFISAETPKTVRSNPAVTDPVVTIVEFADFQCPYCAEQAPDLRRLKADYSGRVVVVFKNFPLPFHARARAAHLAALAAERQGKFWEMHDLIFSHPGRLSTEDFDQYANLLGLDTARFHTDMEAASESAAVDRDVAEGEKLGVTGTPTLFVNGHKLEGVQHYARLKLAIQAELKGEQWLPAARPAVQKRVEVNTKGAPAQGPDSAPVTIVEFSDFQCPFCGGAVPLLKQLMAENSGKVRWVFKNFPLDFHADSPLAHMAALAAGEQGKFWEMHDLIFAHHQAIKHDDLLGLASSLKLDMARFQRDLDDPKLKERIEADKKEGTTLGIEGTPTFVINGEVVSGFSPTEFQGIVDRHLVQGTPAGRLDSQLTVPDLGLSLGPKDAPIKIQWYADLGSPLTARSAVALQQFMSAHAGAVQVQFKNFPLPNRDDSLLLHEFALAAAAQGKFWTVEALLLADSRPKDRNELKSLASQVGLDQNKLWAEIDENKYSPVINRDLIQAQDIGVKGTPTFVVGEKKLDGVNGLDTLNLK